MMGCEDIETWRARVQLSACITTAALSQLQSCSGLPPTNAGVPALELWQWPPLLQRHHFAVLLHASS